MARKSASQADRTSVPFSFTPSGHLVATAKIGRKSLRLVIDTGAGADFIIDSSVASEFGLEPEPGTESDDVRGVGTAKHSMHLLRVPALTLGAVTIENPVCVGIDLTHVREAGGKRGLHGLLGGTFLRARKAIVDYGTRRLSFQVVAPKTRKPRRQR